MTRPYEPRCPHTWAARTYVRTQGCLADHLQIPFPARFIPRRRLTTGSVGGAGSYVATAPANAAAGEWGPACVQPAWATVWVAWASTRVRPTLSIVRPATVISTVALLLPSISPTNRVATHRVPRLLSR